MLKSWVHFVHMTVSPKAHGNGQTTIRRLFEVLFWATMDYPHTYSQTHTWESLWGHCFLIHFCTCLYLLPVLPFLHVWVSPSHSKKKRKEKQRGWIWAEKHPLGLFPFLKELLQISCLIYEGGLRRDTSWHDRHSPSLSEKCGSDRTRPGVICQSPSGPRDATDWSTAGSKTNPFIGTKAWLIKQVPLGQKAAGVSLLRVPVSARLAGRHTPPHKRGGNATFFFNVGMYMMQEKHDRMLLFASI